VFDGATYVIVALTFLLAGIVKGMVGLGLPTVSLAVLTVAIGIQPAMALLLAPSFVTHVWQAVAGTHALAILARLWLFMLATVMTIWLGVSLASSLRMWALVALLGVVLVVYAMIGLCDLRLSMAKHRAVCVSPLAGLLTGVCTGLTGAFEALGAGYFQAVDLPRHQLVQAMAMLCTMSTVGLAVALHEQGLLTTELEILSAGAVVPAVIGMRWGKRWRNKMSAARFRRVFFVVLLVLGLCILTPDFTTGHIFLLNDDMELNGLGRKDGFTDDFLDSVDVCTGRQVHMGGDRRIDRTGIDVGQCGLQ